MNLEQIAEMHHCDTRHARDRIVLVPGFPLPVPCQHATAAPVGAR